MTPDSLLTIVTPATSQDLVTLADTKDELDITTNTANQFLTRAIRQASSAIATHCGRVFIAEQVTETFRAAGSPLGFFGASAQQIALGSDGANFPRAEAIALKRYPVSAVASVVEDDITLVEGTDFEVDGDKGWIYRLNTDLRISWGFVKLVVTYTGGYAADAVPDDLQNATLRLITARYTARGRDPMLRGYEVPGVLSEQFWVGGIGEDTALPPEVAGLVSGYVEVRV